MTKGDTLVIHRMSLLQYNFRFVFSLVHKETQDLSLTNRHNKPEESLMYIFSFLKFYH